MSITPRQMITPQSKWNIKCPYSMQPEAITVHNTANDASANNEISYMNNNNNQVSFHFAVDDKEVVQGIPLDRNAWHAGDGGSGYGNRKTIGIEICYSLSGGERFDKAEKLAARFIAQLLQERKWGVERVGTHQLRSGKYCPHRTLDYGWERFKSMVQAELNALNKPTIVWVDDTPATYIAINDTALYAIEAGGVVKRYGAGTQFEFVQHCTYNGNAYYRTAYSRDNNINNGIPVADVAVPQPPKPTAVKWEDIDTTKFMAKEECKLIELKSQSVVKVYPVGEIIEVTQKATYNGVVYYRTSYSASKNIDNGFPADNLIDYVEPTPEPSVTPDVPEPTLPKVPDPEPSVDYDENMAKSLWATIYEALVKFIRVIMGKES